jgi:hypothetical protein
MLAISLFVVYRYIKSLEKQMNQLSLQIDVFNTDINKIKQKELISKLSVPDLVSGSLENILAHVEPEIPLETCPLFPRTDNEDMVSICNSVSSEELMKLVHNIDSEEEDNNNTLEDDNTLEENTLEDNTPVDNTLEENTLEENTLEEEEQIKSENIETTNEELSKLTNEDLKKILKKLNMSIKGTKVELVKRILDGV